VLAPPRADLTSWARSFIALRSSSVNAADDFRVVVVRLAVFVVLGMGSSSWVVVVITR
jgi:hypothetical protein